MAAPAGFELKFNERELRHLLADPGGPVGRGILTKAGEIVTRGAKSRAPIRTGRLYDSIGWHLEEDTRGVYVKVSAVFYARFLDKPAKQILRPRRFLRTALRDIRKTHLGEN